MLRINVTHDGVSGDIDLKMDEDATDHDIKCVAVEILRAGGVPGMTRDLANNVFDHYVVDRLDRADGAGRAFYLRPKTPFGARFAIVPGQEQAYAEYVARNSQDGYSARCVSYSEDWAVLMEAEMAKGVKLPYCAEATSHQADTDGITGFMHGCAVQGLARFWVHGEELRRWHNLSTQLGKEGKQANEKPGVVLNPAIVTIE